MIGIVHFAWEGGGLYIIGRTAIGRTSVAALRLNDPYHQSAEWAMPRFSTKDILRGITLASIGFGMLAVGFNRQPEGWAKDFLIAFGGMFVGYGFAFPFKHPPHQMILAMGGMFAANSWHLGSRFGLIVYVGLTALVACVHLIYNLIAKRAVEAKLRDGNR